MVARQREIDCGRAWARWSSLCNSPHYAGHIQALQINEVGDDAYVRKLANSYIYSYLYSIIPM